MATIPVLSRELVLGAVSPSEAIRRVRMAFEAHAEGRWYMPAKVYLDTPPGDFRAMPASGDGLALLKWVTSFPDNPSRGLPTVTGIILASDAGTGEPAAVIDARSVTALRTGASAAIASQVLARDSAESVGIIGCGLHGAWATRCLAAAGFTNGVCFDPHEEAARQLADELGWRTGDLDAALACDIVTTITPGREAVVDVDRLRPGVHLNALGADAAGKAELTIEAVVACHVFCDEWTQASHGGEIHGAVEAGKLDRAAVTELGDVLLGRSGGRASDEEMTLFDSTGLAIQDLAIAHALIEGLAAGEIDAPTITL